jgi:hypothetical protein
MSGAAVIPTSPPRAPFKVIPGSGLPKERLDQAVAIAPMAPAEAARVVVTATVAKSCSDRGQSGSGVEAVPAEPEDEHTECSEHERMARDGLWVPVLIELADPRPEHQHPGEGSDATHHVHDARSRRSRSTRVRRAILRPRSSG